MPSLRRRFRLCLQEHIMRLYLKVYPSGDFTAYPEQKARSVEPAISPQKSLSALGLSHPVNSHKELEAAPQANSSQDHISVAPQAKLKKARAARGSGGLTRYGAIMVRSSCQLLEEKANGKIIGLLTLTLPTMTTEQLREATKNWSEIMRQFLQALSRQFERVGLPNEYVYVTEWQRLRGALHAHVAFVASNEKAVKSANDYPIHKTWYKNTWKQILLNVLGQEFDCSAATRIEKVKLSVGAYLSKYISKGDKPKKTQIISSSIDKKMQNGLEQNSQQVLDSISNCNADIVEPRHDNATQTYNTDSCDRTLELMQTSLRLWFLACKYSSQEDADNYRAVVQICIFALKERRYKEQMLNNVTESLTQECHPCAWWGAYNELKTEVKSRVETWSIKLGEIGAIGAVSHTEEWMLIAENILSKIAKYWQRRVYTGGQIARGIAGRFRLQSGWKEMAMESFLGRQILPQHFKRLQKYWRWRYQRDGCDPWQDKAAEADYIFKISKSTITYGI